MCVCTSVCVCVHHHDATEVSNPVFVIDTSASLKTTILIIVLIGPTPSAETVCPLQTSRTQEIVSGSMTFVGWYGPLLSFLFDTFPSFLLPLHHPSCLTVCSCPSRYSVRFFIYYICTVPLCASSVLVKGKEQSLL